MAGAAREAPNPLRAMDEPRWRTAAIVVAVIAALEFVALASAGVFLVASPGANAAAKSPAAAASTPRRHGTARVPAAKSKLTRAQTEVMVLNGDGETGAAAAAAARLREHGYLVGNVGNAIRDTYQRSIVMYRRGYAAEGTRLAQDLHVPIVSPLDGMRPAQLVGSQLVLIVGA